MYVLGSGYTLGHNGDRKIIIEILFFLWGFNGEGNGNPFQYSCLENSMDRLWGREELDTTE